MRRPSGMVSTRIRCSMSSMGQDRNFACRVHDEYTFRGLKVVVMENQLLRISILADKGTDIYINLWRNYHGNPDFMSYRRYYCMGVEPFSSIPSLGLLEAINRGTQLTLKGRESLESELKAVVYTGLSGVKRITPEGQVLAL